MMIVLFTTSKYPTSWLIRKLTGDDCSHCALYSPISKQVLHCNFLGLQVEEAKDFLKSNKIKHQISIKDSNIHPRELYEKYKDVKYDFLALLYSGLRIIFRGLPKVNLWQTTGMFLCTEFVTDILDGEEDSLITPHKLYHKLSEKESQNG